MIVVKCCLVDSLQICPVKKRVFLTELVTADSGYYVNILLVGLKNIETEAVFTQTEKTISETLIFFNFSKITLLILCESVPFLLISSTSTNLIVERTF